MEVTDYLTCINCSTGTVRTLNSTIGKCSKCAATQKLNQCSQSKSAQFVIVNNENEKYHITAYNEQLETLLTEHEYMSIEKRLLMNTNVTVLFSSENTGRMLECEFCSCWSHCKCVGLTVAFAPSFPFVCLYCVSLCLLESVAIVLRSKLKCPLSLYLLPFLTISLPSLQRFSVLVRP